MKHSSTDPLELTVFPEFVALVARVQELEDRLSEAGRALLFAPETPEREDQDTA